MIRSFNDSEAERIFHRTPSRRLPVGIQKTACRKLVMLNNAREIRDLRVPSGNRLEALHGDREGQHSIRVNQQWRMRLR